MLPIMAKLSGILKSECVNTLEFSLLLERVKGDNDSAIKNINITIIHLVLMIFPYQPATTMTAKLP